MHLSQIRQAIFDLADWSPLQSAEAKARADRFINLVLQQMVYKHPRLLEREVSLFTLPDEQSDPDVATDTLTAVADGALAWVMRLNAVPATMPVAWPTDGSWEGRQLEFQDADGIWHSNVVREIWYSIKDNRFFLSLVRPIEITVADSPYIIWSPYLVLPSDVVNIKRPRIVNSLGSISVEFEDRGMSAATDLTQLFDLREYIEPGGFPSLVTPGPRQFLPGPENKPAVALYAQAPLWVGPSPAGQLEYVLTYTWGRRDIDTRTNLGFREPLYESPPSPASDKITVVYGGPAVQLKLPAIDWMLDFYNALGGGGPYNKDLRSGIRVRIWRRRYTATTVGGPVDPENVTVTHGWALIAEVDGSTLSWTDDGSVLEDRTRRLKPSEAHDTLCLYPRPLERSELRVDAVIRPQALESDADAPALPEDGLALLIYRAAHQLYQSMNEKTWAATALQLAQEAEEALIKHRGRLSPTRRQRRLCRGGMARTQ